jgi:hypothetical protein
VAKVYITRWMVAPAGAALMAATWVRCSRNCAAVRVLHGSLNWMRVDVAAVGVPALVGLCVGAGDVAVGEVGEAVEGIVDGATQPVIVSARATALPTAATASRRIRVPFPRRDDPTGTTLSGRAKTVDRPQSP